MKTQKKVLTVLVTLVMMLTMIPSMAFADAAAMPPADNGVIKLTENVTLTETFAVAAGEEITIDLNGYTISMEKSEKITANHEMIANKGTLTIEDNSSAQTGKITYNYTGPDTASDNYGTGGKASNTITNSPGGKLIINGGTIENLTVNKGTTDTSMQIAYAIDSRTNGDAGDVYVEINGGTIACDGIGVRAFGNSTTCTNAIVITDGTFNTGVQLQDSNKNKNLMTAEISGGEFTSTRYSLYVYGTGDASGIDVNVSGGTFNNTVYFASVSSTAVYNAEISGGEFKDETLSYAWAAGEDAAYVPVITGGTFATDVSAIVKPSDTTKLEEQEDGTFEIVCAHNNTVNEDQPADCTNDGYTGALFCTDCQLIVEEGTVVPAGHDYEDGVCTVCGAADPESEGGATSGGEGTTGGSNDGAEDENAAESDDKADSAVKTGDDTPLALYGAVMLMALVAMAFALRRKVVK